MHCSPVKCTCLSETWRTLLWSISFCFLFPVSKVLRCHCSLACLSVRAHFSSYSRTQTPDSGPSRKPIKSWKHSQSGCKIKHLSRRRGWVVIDQNEDCGCFVDGLGAFLLGCGCAGCLDCESYNLRGGLSMTQDVCWPALY